MKTYVTPEIKTLDLNTKDICNSSGPLTELYDIGLDPHAEDIDNW